MGLLALFGRERCFNCSRRATRELHHAMWNRCDAGEQYAVRGLTQLRGPCRTYLESGHCEHRTWYRDRRAVCDVCWQSWAPLEIDGSRCHFVTSYMEDGKRYHDFFTEDGRKFWQGMDGGYHDHAVEPDTKLPGPRGTMPRGWKDEQGRGVSRRNST